MTVLQNQPRAFTTLPREFYLEGPLFEAEMRRIWHREWLYLGRVSEIPDPGDFIVRQVVGEGVLLVRTADEIVGLLNVCRHRGARIVDGGCGNAKRFTCPYHQWTFDLEGRLRGAPSRPDGEEVDYEALGMYRVPVEIWSGFVFGSVGGTAPPPLSAQIEELAPRLSDYAPEHMRQVARRTYDCRANWKVMLENYLECYHCSSSHPEFCKTADLRIRSGAEYSRQASDQRPYWSTDVPLRAGMKSTSLTGDYVCRVPLSGEDDSSCGQSRSFGDWAAVCVLHFYADYAMVHEIEPVTATTTRFHLTWFVNEDAQDSDFDTDDLIHVWDATTRQDVELIEWAPKRTELPALHTGAAELSPRTLHSLLAEHLPDRHGRR